MLIERSSTSAFRRSDGSLSQLTVAARKARLAAERKKQQQVEDANLAKIRDEHEAKAAEEGAREAARVREACADIYKRTADKKLGDLTVRESQQVQVCQLSGLYRPQ